MGMTFRCPFSQHVIGISFTEEEKVAQLCLTLCDPMDCNLPGSSVQGISQVGILEWVAFPSLGDLLESGIEPGSAAMQVDSLPSEPSGKFFSDAYYFFPSI